MENKIYLIMNKPAGYVCKANADQNKTVFELLPENLQSLVQGEKRGNRLHTVGRLDKDTTGLLLLTTDGQFSHYLTAPENKIEKKYLVKLEQDVNKEQQQQYIEKAFNGLLLPAEKKAPEEMSLSSKLSFTDTKTCIITVTEGKFHEVRRIFLALGNKVVQLKRLQMGTFVLPEDLREGEILTLRKEDFFRSE